MTTNHHFQQLLLPQKTDHPSDLLFKRKQQQRTLINTFTIQMHAKQLLE